MPIISLDFGKRLLILLILLSLFSDLVQFTLSIPQNSGTVSEPSCPLEGKSNITFRNLCEMYITCEDGRLRLETCPDSLYYNQRKQICDLRIHVQDCEPLDKHAPTTARPSRKLIARIKQNFECDPLDIVVKRKGKRRCRVQIICANGVSFVLRRCMQTISFRV
ncbi:unnamed protein product [Orchesella dallaii]|uniref:Chitin-binding type-2 domain-containing protein n=1 Tax=Orchesella dallaii TaxID=48710 RepID=A0ABP1PWQ4_9HEXA